MGGKTSGHGLSFTSRCNNLARVLPTEVLVESAVKTNTQIKIKAIWDTGASSSLIRPEVATALDLKPVSKELMSTPSDKDVPTNVYLINLYLPNRVKVLEVRVLEGTPNACDMLIGMDVISMGDFAVTNYNGSTMFSFRMPSMTHIDFTKHSHIEPIRNEVQKVGRNDPCPCGSGKKYKQCCGR